MADDNVYVDVESDNSESSLCFVEKSEVGGKGAGSGGPPENEDLSMVKERFEQGCECSSDSSLAGCFSGMDPDFVYRHRLNIAELTRAEHDMYLMGLTMATMPKPEETAKHKERKRLRTQYVFQVPAHTKKNPETSSPSPNQKISSRRARRSAWRHSCTWRTARSTS